MVLRFAATTLVRRPESEPASRVRWSHNHRGDTCARYVAVSPTYMAVRNQNGIDRVGCVNRERNTLGYRLAHSSSQALIARHSSRDAGRLRLPWA